MPAYPEPHELRLLKIEYRSDAAPEIRKTSNEINWMHWILDSLEVGYVGLRCGTDREPEAGLAAKGGVFDANSEFNHWQ